MLHCRLSHEGRLLICPRVSRSALKMTAPSLFGKHTESQPPRNWPKTRRFHAPFMHTFTHPDFCFSHKSIDGSSLKTGLEWAKGYGCLKMKGEKKQARQKGQRLVNVCNSPLLYEKEKKKKPRMPAFAARAADVHKIKPIHWFRAAVKYL